MQRMRQEALSRGVITASTGNHAQSIAYAGALIGARVIIVMPQGVPSVKAEAVRELGAEIVTHGTFYDQAREHAEQLASAKGYLHVHGINEPLLHEGVATMHLEIFEDKPDIEIVINPIGGGSGASGACIVYKTLNPRIKVIGVQAKGAPAFYNSWKEGRITSAPVETQAEGLATAQAYELPLRILKALDDMVLVSDNEMKNAVKRIFETTGQIAELSGAASTAAAFKIKDKIKRKKLALIITGGNIEAKQLAQILAD